VVAKAASANPRPECQLSSRSVAPQHPQQDTIQNDVSYTSGIATVTLANRLHHVASVQMVPHCDAVSARRRYIPSVKGATHSNVISKVKPC
jgi:hypothetical protein